MFGIFKKPESYYKVDWDKVETLDELKLIVKCFMGKKVFRQKMIIDYPESKKFLRKIEK